MVTRAINTLGKILLIVFLIWHMFAVAIYSIPREAEDVFSKWTRIDVLPIVTPYMFATSQWQLWNIFAPDPLRRVTSYVTLVEDGNVWREIDTVTPDSYSVFRHATHLKMLGNLLDDLKDDRAPFAGRYLQLQCDAHKVASGSRIRLMYRSYVLPIPTASMRGEWWDAWTPTSSDAIGYTITCP